MTGATSWRDAEPDQYAGAVLAAAEQLGVLPLAVEKDYWVCQALRAITLAHPDQVIFKGGTSLEKLRIIRRFSEDLDLLVFGEYESKRAAERALKAMVDTAATATRGAPTEEKGGGKPGSFHRRAYLTPPMTHSGAAGPFADASAILLELGQSGGPHPHGSRPVTSLLGRQLSAAPGFTISAWDDLAEFQVAVLHPGRTLIEKLLRINNFANDLDAQAGVHGWPRIGRQFYDIWALLGTAEVLDLLANTPLAAEVLASCYEVSEAFTPDLPAPTGGFAACAAFKPDGALADRLRGEHESAMAGLYYGTEEPPSFVAVLERVHEKTALLAIEPPSP